MDKADLAVGDRVRIDIPDERDPDHRRFHGEHGEVIAVIEDDLGVEPRTGQESPIFRIELDSGETFDARRWNLRPPID